MVPERYCQIKFEDSDLCLLHLLFGKSEEKRKAIFFRYRYIFNKRIYFLLKKSSRFY